MAGVYTWFEESYRFVVLTTAANESVSSVHERMPLILKDKDAMEWLMDDEKAKKLLKKVPGKLQKTAEYEQMVLPFVQ